MCGFMMYRMMGKGPGLRLKVAVEAAEHLLLNDDVCFFSRLLA